MARPHTGVAFPRAIGEDGLPIKQRYDIYANLLASRAMNGRMQASEVDVAAVDTAAPTIRSARRRVDTRSTLQKIVDRIQRVRAREIAARIEMDAGLAGRRRNLVEDASLNTVPEKRGRLIGKQALVAQTATVANRSISGGDTMVKRRRISSKRPPELPICSDANAAAPSEHDNGAFGGGLPEPATV